jgi:hypothetical protein
MTLHTLREMRDVAPFKPFEIHLSDGRVLPVITTDHLLFMPKRPEFIVVLPDGGLRIIDPDQVVSVGLGPPRLKSGGPGSSARR